MTSSPSRARGARVALSGLVLASTVFGTVLVPATANAAGAPALQASFATTVVNDAVTEATFTVRNTGATATVAEVTFEVPKGSVHNRLDARSSLTVDGTTATVSVNGGLAAGQSIDLPLWVLNGAGTLPEHCTIAGNTVEGCSAPGEAADQPVGEEAAADQPGDAVDQPDGGDTAPGQAAEGGAAGEQPAGDDAAPEAPADDTADRPQVTYPTVTSGHTDVPVTPLGDALDAWSEDGTRFDRSDLRQASRWIKKRQMFVVKVPDGMTSAEIAIGQYGNHLGINGCRDVGIWTQHLTPGENIIHAPHDGLVSVINRSTTESGVVTVSGGYPVPTFVAGKTDRAAFDEQLRNWKDSPFLELIGERVQADVRRTEPSDPRAPQNEALLAGNDLDARIGRWDSIIATNEEFWGATGAHRVHFATPSYGNPGGSEYADAHRGWIAFPNDIATPHQLLTGDTSAGGENAVRRAVGQVFQQRVLTWRNFFDQNDSSVAEGLASVVIEERLNGRNALDQWKDKVQGFRSAPIGKRDFWSNQLPDAARPLMFDQLRRAHGDDVIRRIAGQANSGVSFGHDARVPFIRAAAQVTQQDLTRFFEEWGITVEDDLRAEMAAYPEPTTPIWDDFDALH